MLVFCIFLTPSLRSVDVVMISYVSVYDGLTNTQAWDASVLNSTGGDDQAERQLFSQLDVDEDKTISFQEFVTWAFLRSHPSDPSLLSDIPAAPHNPVKTAGSENKGSNREAHFNTNSGGGLFKIRSKSPGPIKIVKNVNNLNTFSMRTNNLRQDIVRLRSASPSPSRAKPTKSSGSLSSTGVNTTGDATGSEITRALSPILRGRIAQVRNERNGLGLGTAPASGSTAGIGGLGLVESSGSTKSSNSTKSKNNVTTGQKAQKSRDNMNMARSNSTRRSSATSGTKGTGSATRG